MSSSGSSSSSLQASAGSSLTKFAWWKQLLMVFSLTLAQALLNRRKASRTLMTVGSAVLMLLQYHQLTVVNLQVLGYTLVHGLCFACGVGWQKISLIALSPWTLGWAGQLSTIIATFLFWWWNFLSSNRSQLVNSCDIIQAFLLASYWVGRVFTFLKQRGFFAFPMT